MEENSGYVGLDGHKDTIAVAIAYPGGSKPKSLGIIANTKKSLLRLIAKVSRNGDVVGFCYEASSCGFLVLARPNWHRKNLAGQVQNYNLRSWSSSVSQRSWPL